MERRRVPLDHPIWGHWLVFSRHQLQHLEQLATYGDWVPLRYTPLRAVLVNHPSLIEDVLVTNHRDYIKPLTIRRFKPLFGEGLFTSEGTFWRRQRRLIQPVFHRDRIRQYASTMVAAGRQAVAGWPDGTERDIHQDLMQLTLQIVGKTLFDADVSSDAIAVGTAITEALRALQDRVESIGILIPDALPTPTNLRLRRATRTLDRLVYRLIAEHRAAPQARTDLLSMLLEARDEDGTGMSDRQLRDEVMTMVLAGHETTALALSWALYLLARHPASEARLREEVSSVLGERAPSSDDLPRLGYTGQVISEALRLYPPAWVLERENIRDTQIGPYWLRRGSAVLLSPWLMHRDGRWFERPLSFEPERWAPELGLARRIGRFAYFPFGGGPRMCIGNTFALTEATLLLATIVQQVRLHLAQATEVVPEPAITLRPRGGVRMRVERVGPVPTIPAWLSASTPH